LKNIFSQENLIDKYHRIKLLNQKPCIIWLTGLSASGKSTLANALEVELYKKGFKTYLLDGDNLRDGLNNDLGFSKKDREENIRRVAHLSQILLDAGLIVITAFISPYKKDRDYARSLVKKDEFIEVFVDTPLEICEKRDPKGLYKKARTGEIKDFTGIDSSYEKPDNAEITIENDNLHRSVEKVFNFLKINI
jgi:adenylylsulfate kinase